jgi:hypothetical protein
VGLSVHCTVVGFLHSAAPDTYARFVAAFRQGLKEAGYSRIPLGAGSIRSAAGAGRRYGRPAGVYDRCDGRRPRGYNSQCDTFISRLGINLFDQQYQDRFDKDYGAASAALLGSRFDVVNETFGRKICRELSLD